MAGLGTFAMALEDDRIETADLRLPHARIRNAIPVTIGEGGAALNGVAEEYYRNSYFAKQNAKKEKMMKYPFINSGEFLRHGWKLPACYVTYKSCLLIGNALGEEHPLASLFNMFGILFNQKYKSTAQTTLPKVMAWYGFAQGGSVVDEMYTAEIGGHEFPVYLKRKQEPLPSPPDFQTLLENHIKIVIKTGKSPYNDPLVANLDIGRYVNQNFLAFSSDKFTRGDVRNKLIDPDKSRRWFVKDDTWPIQQYGERKDLGTITIAGNSFKIRNYKRPSPFMVWLYWAAGDKIYDFIDAPFDPVQELFPADVQQILVYQEYKGIAGVRRTVFNGGVTPTLKYG